MVAWLGWSFVFLLFCSDFHESFSLLAISPLIVWLGFYLSEIFRNPLFPFPLQLAVDSMIFTGLLLSVVLMILTFQIVPHPMIGGFVLLSFVLAILSIVMLLLRDYTISRLLPSYLLPFSLLICVLAKLTIEPLFYHNSAQELARLLPRQTLETANTTILEWADNAQNTASMIRFITPLKNKVFMVNSEEQLEAKIQTRQGSVYLILPEAQFYDLPASVRGMGYPMGSSWQWKVPLSFTLLTQALFNETLDFKALSEPVILFKIPAMPDLDS
jgi:hypothetical protein